MTTTQNTSHRDGEIRYIKGHKFGVKIPVYWSTALNTWVTIPDYEQPVYEDVEDIN